MNIKNLFKLSLIKRFAQIKSWIKFKLLHPDVPIINPLLVGTFNSQFGQDLFLTSLAKNYLKDNPNLNIVDIGANHPVNFSNSYFFEKVFNSKVYAIEPISSFQHIWNKFRKNATFLPYAIGAKDLSEIVLHVPDESAQIDNMFSSLLKKTSHLNSYMNFKELKVPCFRLDTLFKTHNLNNIFLISIDVEGYELEVLKGIDFENVTIDCFLIENNTHEPYGSEPIRNFLKSKGYIFYSRIYCADDVFLSKMFFEKLNDSKNL
jgi:FkbM family methyltransferase